VAIACISDNLAFAATTQSKGGSKGCLKGKVTLEEQQAPVHKTKHGQPAAGLPCQPIIDLPARTRFRAAQLATIQQIGEYEVIGRISALIILFCVE